MQCDLHSPAAAAMTTLTGADRFCMLSLHLPHLLQKPVFKLPETALRSVSDQQSMWLKVLGSRWRFNHLVQDAAAVDYANGHEADWRMLFCLTMQLSYECTLWSLLQATTALQALAAFEGVAAVSQPVANSVSVTNLLEKTIVFSHEFFT